MNSMLLSGFEPESLARKARMIGRSTLQEQTPTSVIEANAHLPCRIPLNLYNRFSHETLYHKPLILLPGVLGGR